MAETSQHLKTIGDRSLAAIMQELASREPIFHRPEWGTSRADFGQVLTAFNRFSRNV